MVNAKHIEMQNEREPVAFKVRVEPDQGGLATMCQICWVWAAICLMHNQTSDLYREREVLKCGLNPVHRHRP